MLKFKMIACIAELKKITVLVLATCFKMLYNQPPFMFAPFVLSNCGDGASTPDMFQSNVQGSKRRG